jgi:hypothetical protein
MAGLEILSDDNYREFLQAGTRVLILTQSDCPHCRRWTEELSEFLKDDLVWKDIRFGRIDLDSAGVEDFKEANDWLEFVEGVPFNIIYVSGQPNSSFPGSGVQRLVRRLQRLKSET